MHINDINIDGYPDIMMIIKENDITTVEIYQNNQASSISEFTQFSEKIRSKNISGTIKSVSYLDVLENGILDILITVEEENTFSKTYLFYNNFLYQNFFFIKGYGAESYG